MAQNPRSLHNSTINEPRVVQSCRRLTNIQVNIPSSLQTESLVEQTRAIIIAGPFYISFLTYIYSIDMCHKHIHHQDNFFNPYGEELHMWNFHLDQSPFLLLHFLLALLSNYSTWLSLTQIHALNFWQLPWIAVPFEHCVFRTCSAREDSCKLHEITNTLFLQCKYLHYNLRIRMALVDTLFLSS